MSSAGDPQMKRDLLVEVNRASAEFFTHLIGLGTGAIVLVTTFSEKFSTDGGAQWLAAGSLIGFSVCIVGSLAVKFLLLPQMYDLALSPRIYDQKERILRWVQTTAFLGSGVGFSAGLVLLAAYGFTTLT